MIADVVVSCPYCGESFGTLIDSGTEAGGGSDESWEDCAVCCRPIRLRWVFDEDGELQSLEAMTDSDV